METQFSHLGMLQSERCHPTCPSLNSSQQLSVVFRSLNHACSAGATAHTSGSSLSGGLAGLDSDGLGLLFAFDLGGSDSGLLSLVRGRHNVAGHTCKEPKQAG